MKSSVAVTVLAVAGSAMAASSIIPTGISASCSTYLAKLDTDTTLTACTSALNSATKAFASGSGSASDVQPALTTLCGDSVVSACNEATIRSALASFYQACTAELTTSPNDNVKLVYDTLYTLAPMRKAACNKDDSGAYCGAASTGKDSAQAAQKALGTTKDGVTVPNASTWVDNNVAFLFAPKTLTSADCNTCTRQVAATFATWESSISYGPGIGASTLLKGQVGVLQNINNVCGATFLSGPVNVGGIGDSVAGKANGAVAAKTGGAMTLAAGVIAAVALF